MTAANHTLTGMVIVAVFSNPVVALPLAFLAHFILDALPHYGNRSSATKSLEGLKYVLPIDMLIALALLVGVVVLQPENWELIVLGGILCASPDLMWIPKYVRHLQGKPNRPNRGIAKFHSWIQWGERPWGIWIELAWFITFVIIALRLI